MIASYLLVFTVILCMFNILSSVSAETDREWIQLIGTTMPDWGEGIAVDYSGNVFVVGGTGGDLYGNLNAGRDDTFVSKYDTEGKLIWAQLYGTTERDWGRGITVDQNGNSYITGRTDGAGFDTENPDPVWGRYLYCQI